MENSHKINLMLLEIKYFSHLSLDLHFHGHLDIEDW